MIKSYKMKSVFTLLFFLLLGFGCISQNSDLEHIENFDVNPNDSSILVAFNNGEVTSIFTAGVEGGKTRPLLLSDGKISYTNPRFSYDGQSFRVH